MEVVSTSGRGPNTVYLVRDGSQERSIIGAKNLPPEVFQRWRNRQAAACMRRARERHRQQRDSNTEADDQPEGVGGSEGEAPTTRVSDQSLFIGDKQVDAQKALELITCKICQDQQVQRLIVPCGHLIFCAQCLSTEMTLRKKCPICREEIKDHFGVVW